MSNEPEPRRGIHPWIIVLIVTVTAIAFAVGALFVVPELQARRKSLNQRNAAACLRVLAEAEADFWMNDGDGNRVRDYWTADIRQLHSIPDLDKADASPGDGAPLVPYQGYLFAAIPLDENGAPYDQGNGRNPAKFAFCAYPADESSGNAVFIVNERKEVWRATSPVNGPVPRWPAKLARDWVKLDLQVLPK